MNFWTSELGKITGDADQAFAKTITQIPDGTTAAAKIQSFKQENNQGQSYYNIDWELIDGEYAGQHIFQKLKTFDADPKKKHRALNMLAYLYKLYELKPVSNNAPTDHELAVFQGKKAGIKIQEWAMTREDGSVMQGNWVSEIHPVDGFETKTGTPKTPPTPSAVDSAFSRNETPQEQLEDDIPF